MPKEFRTWKEGKKAKQEIEEQERKLMFGKPDGDTSIPSMPAEVAKVDQIKVSSDQMKEFEEVYQKVATKGSLKLKDVERAFRMLGVIPTARDI
jgi:hypothetical protein